jgi:hypothetical protein
MDFAPRLGDTLLDAKYQEIRRLATGNPAKDSSFPPRDGLCHWNRLPRELRDEIFKYAYGRRAGGLKILFKSEIELYNKLDSSWMGSSNRFRVSIVHMRTSAQQFWRYGQMCTKLMNLTSLSVSSITSTDSSFVKSGPPKLPRLCSPPLRYASRVTSQAPSFHTPAWA